jgi:hypothetical protein
MKYFFDLQDGTCIRDEQGHDFPDDGAALLYAAKIARDLSKLPVHALEWSMLIKNEYGLCVGSVPLTPALEEHAPVIAEGLLLPD